MFTLTKKLEASVEKHLTTIELLKKELQKKTDEAKGYKDACFNVMESSTAELVIQKILKRGLKWFDYKKLSRDEQETYYREAQSILHNQVFINELASYTLDLVEEIAKNSKDFDEVLRLRAKISMGQVFRERLESIIDPSITEKEPTDPHSTI